MTETIRFSHDHPKLWMMAMQEVGWDTDLLIARIDDEAQAEPTWYPLPHSEFDGVGAFGYLLRRHGHPELLVLPQHDPGPCPSFISLLRAGVRFAEWPIGSGRSVYPASSSFKATPRRIAWRVLNSSQTRQVVGQAKKQGVSVGTWLLFTLNRAVEPLLSSPEKPSRWMVPVNMRGAIVGPSDTANHVSYLRPSIALSDSPLILQDTLRQHLAAGEHWLMWYGYRYGSLLGLFSMRMLLRADLKWGKPYVGCFSNLGDWGLSGHSAWIGSPPVAKSMPVGAGCITYGGRMGLTLRLHSNHENAESIAKATLDDWIEKAVG
jgi:hypothetical protein